MIVNRTSCHVVGVVGLRSQGMIIGFESTDLKRERSGSTNLKGTSGNPRESMITLSSMEQRARDTPVESLL